MTDYNTTVGNPIILETTEDQSFVYMQEIN